MNIELEKLELMKQLVETNDSSVILAIKNIFKAKKKDFWDELTDKQKFEIEESDREIERGEFFLYEEVMAKYR